VVGDAFADEIDGSMTRFALRFPLYSPLVASMITGLNSEAQVNEAVAAVGGAPRPDIFNRAYDPWKSGFEPAA
jgi:aryl-alcohol dehydrogenase-like predicted oxidoreductase